MRCGLCEETQLRGGTSDRVEPEFPPFAGNLGKSPAEKKGPLEEEAIVTNLSFSLPVPPEPHGGPGVSPMALVLHGFTRQSSASD